MSGVITTRHLFWNAGVIMREFGLACYVRCWRQVFSSRRCTFLECI